MEKLVKELDILGISVIQCSFREICELHPCDTPYVNFSDEDAECAECFGDLELNFSVISEADPTSVGRTVYDTARRLGIHVDWNGRAWKKIKLFFNAEQRKYFQSNNTS